MLQSHSQFAARAPAAPREPAALLPAAVAAALALMIVSINPVGYLGGGSDDWQYLEAARCIASQGFCVPESHWAARLPMVLPTGAALALVGEARGTIWLVPLFYGLAALLLFVGVVQRAFGRMPALLAGAAMAVTPMAGGELLALNVSTVEFCFAIAALFALQNALRSGRSSWAAFSGALLAIAILSRATAFAFLPIAAIGAVMLRPEDRRHLLFVAAGLGAVLAAEMLVYAALTADPFHGWRLALGHTQLHSSELSAAGGAAASPLFNPEVIAGWKRSMGIHVHWTIDGALNLLADPQMGLTLWAALILLVMGQRTAAPSERAGKASLLLLGAACLYFGALTYGLAVDPKPRMFVPVAAAAAAIIGIQGARVWKDGGRALIVLLFAVLGANAAAYAYNGLDMRPVERTAAAWASEAPAETAVDETARRALTLSPAVRRLTPLPAPRAKRMLMLASGGCDAAFGEEWRLARVARFEMHDPAPLAALRSRHILLGRVEPLALCEFRRVEPGPAAALPL